MSLEAGQILVDLQDKTSLEATLDKLIKMAQTKQELRDLHREWDSYYCFEFGRMNNEVFEAYPSPVDKRYTENPSQLAFYHAVLQHDDLDDKLASYVRENLYYYWDTDRDDHMGAMALSELIRKDTQYIPLFLEWARRFHPQYDFGLIEKWSQPIIEHHGINQETIAVIVWRITTHSMESFDHKMLESFITWCTEQQNLEQFLSSELGQAAFRTAAEIECREQSEREWRTLYEMDTWEVYPNLYKCLIDIVEQPLAWREWHQCLENDFQGIEGFKRWDEIDPKQELIVNEAYTTPLKLAESLGKKKVASLLRERGCTK